MLKSTMWWQNYKCSNTTTVNSTFTLQQQSSHNTPACSMCCVEAKVQHVVLRFASWCILLTLHHCTIDIIHHHAVIHYDVKLDYPVRWIEKSSTLPFEMNTWCMDERASKGKIGCQKAHNDCHCYAFTNFAILHICTILSAVVVYNGSCVAVAVMKFWLFFVD